MNASEIKQATRLLAERTERTETIGLDGGGRALTAYWLGGGQKIFYTLEAVRQYITDREQVAEHRRWMDEQTADA